LIIFDIDIDRTAILWPSVFVIEGRMMNLRLCTYNHVVA